MIVNITDTLSLVLLLTLVLQQPVIGQLLSSSDAICLSQQCVEVSARMSKFTDDKLDPCQDFHEYSCGGVLVNNPHTTKRTLMDVILKRGRIMMEEEEEEDMEDWQVLQKAKRHYRACMDEDKLEELGVEPLKAKLREMGGWPVLEDVGNSNNNNNNSSSSKWDQQHHRWYEQVYSMSKLGLNSNYIFGLSMGLDMQNSSMNMLYLTEPSFGLKRDDLIGGLEHKNVQQYYTYMQKVAVLLGINSETAARELKKSLLFEIELAKIARPKNGMYNTVVLGSYESLEPGHPPSWKDYVNHIISPYNSVTDQDTIIVTHPDYIINVSEILANTEPRVIANYLGWRAAMSAMKYLNKAARKMKIKVMKLNVHSNRWKTCVNEIGFNSKSDSSFKILAGSLYAKRFIIPETKRTVLDMTRQLKKSFLQNLNRLEWMDSTTKKRARNKLARLQAFVAYPDEILNMTFVEKHYRGVEINSNDFFGNVLRLKLWNKGLIFGKLKEKESYRSSSLYQHSPVATVTAFYERADNSIRIPAGMLQGVYFHPKAPKYLNFGAIGYIIGHEIAHGFDDAGQEYDAVGNLQPWWEKETKQQFAEKVRCFEEQYSNFSDAKIGVNLNGVSTRTENIADHGGIKVAYAAFEQWEKEHGKEPSLPNHDLSSRQLFWLSYAQVYCNRYSENALKKIMLTGTHAPGKYRVNGPLMNSPKFAEDFKCPLGSRMNPVKKCEMW